MASPPAPPSSAGWKIITAVAVEIARLGEIPGCAEQNRGVAVVAAGVHLARRLGGVRQAGDLLDRQGVHVGADADHAPASRRAALDDGDDAGAADALHHLVAAELPALLGDDARGAVHVVEQLRVLVEVAAPDADLVGHLGHAV